jgi:hypothetical protein
MFLNDLYRRPKLREYPLFYLSIAFSAKDPYS